MRLERLEINGFKSFSDRSELAFDKGVTAIVGPNGQYRYFAPAGGPSCNFIYTGDCGTQQLYFVGSGGSWASMWSGKLLCDRFVPAPGPLDNVSGIIPATRAMVVIKIGRSRSRLA